MRRTTRSRMVPALTVLAAVVGLGLAGCSSPADDAASTTTTAAPSTTPTTSAPVTSPTTSGAPSTAPASTAATAVPPPTTSGALTPGEPCTLGSDPDCIDPLGDGRGVYLIGGADCMAAAAKGAFDPSSCADLDGDGRAGYPDSG